VSGAEVAGHLTREERPRCRCGHLYETHLHHSTWRTDCGLCGGRTRPDGCQRYRPTRDVPLSTMVRLLRDRAWRVLDR
jgi:hypothetical protein